MLRLQAEEKMNKDVHIMKMLKMLRMALICLVIAGCGQNRDQMKNAQLQQFLQKKRSPVSGIEYRVLPPDVLAINSDTIPELANIAQQVRPDGKISLPLVGEVFVAGLTPREIRQEVIAGAQKFYKKVDITVYILGYNSQKVYIFGQVSRAGCLPWTGCDTLLDILAQTQPTPLAWPEKIKIIRARKPNRGGYLPEAKSERMVRMDAQKEALDAGDETEIRNSQGAQELEINLTSMVESGDMSHNIILQPDDVIFVPPNPFAAVGMAFQQILFPVQGAVQLIQAPGDVDTEYWYWKNRKKYNSQYINVRSTGNIPIIPIPGL
jgi:protein involved in polysaccharide export with SLBB domain